MRRIKLLFSLSLFIFQFSQVSAQRAEIGMNEGAAGYIGELNPDQIFNPSGINVGLFGRLNFDPHWSVGMHLNYGNVQGETYDFREKPFDITHEYKFSTRLYEVSMIAQFNFIDMYSPGKKARWSPYLFAGLGGLYFTPRVDSGNGMMPAESENQVKPRMDSYNNYKNYGIVIPAGMGLKYKQTENWTWHGSFGYRHVFNEYLDVYSNKNLYVSASGDSGVRKRDAYLFVNIGISYTFVSPKCFTF
ncbi:MAG: hypothetical protein EOO99_02355 [Pedobacter sp.]|nr:MAG: hypothetical protein EOO99_02355 [Pedobacter sp.]